MGSSRWGYAQPWRRGSGEVKIRGTESLQPGTVFPYSANCKMPKVESMPTIHIFVSYSHRDGCWVKEGPYGLVPGSPSS